MHNDLKRDREVMGEYADMQDKPLDWTDTMFYVLKSIFAGIGILTAIGAIAYWSYK